MSRKHLLIVLVLSCSLHAKDKPAQKDEHPAQPSLIDRLLGPDPGSGAGISSVSPGSTYAGNGYLTDLAADLHAKNVGDLVTIVVLDQASATSQGVTTQQRTSSANSSISSLFGAKSAHNALNNLANISGSQQL